MPGKDARERCLSFFFPSSSSSSSSSSREKTTSAPRRHRRGAVRQLLPPWGNDVERPPAGFLVPIAIPSRSRARARAISSETLSDVATRAGEQI